MEDGSGKREDVIAADGASVAGAARNPVVLALDLAFDAQRDPARPSPVQHVFKASVIVREVRLKLFGGVFLLGRDGLSAVHGVYPFLTVPYWYIG